MPCDTDPECDFAEKVLRFIPHLSPCISSSVCLSIRGSMLSNNCDLFSSMTQMFNYILTCGWLDFRLPPPLLCCHCFDRPRKRSIVFSKECVTWQCKIPNNKKKKKNKTRKNSRTLTAIWSHFDFQLDLCQTVCFECRTNSIGYATVAAARVFHGISSSCCCPNLNLVRGRKFEPINSSAMRFKMSAIWRKQAARRRIQNIWWVT